MKRPCHRVESFRFVALKLDLCIELRPVDVGSHGILKLFCPFCAGKGDIVERKILQKEEFSFHRKQIYISKFLTTNVMTIVNIF